jgi:hypothetical protein
MLGTLWSAAKRRFSLCTWSLPVPDDGPRVVVSKSQKISRDSLTRSIIIQNNPTAAQCRLYLRQVLAKHELGDAWLSDESLPTGFPGLAPGAPDRPHAMVHGVRLSCFLCALLGLRADVVNYIAKSFFLFIDRRTQNSDTYKGEMAARRASKG